MSPRRNPAFMPVILLGGLLFGFGLAHSTMAQPEVVLSFLRLEDLGLLLVMAGGAGVMMLTIFGARAVLQNPPLTTNAYKRRRKHLDRKVIAGGGIFGVGWGLTGVCPGAGLASLGIGNYPILLAIGGMFVGAYLQGYWRSARQAVTPSPATAD